MSDIGYKNASQAGLWISANSLEEYIADLTCAIRTPHPAYQRIGVLAGDGYRQLNANQLQIENEYYSAIRPKRSALSGERPTAALRRGGVEYVELRALDLDPYAPTGVDETALRFAEVFLAYCLLADSPPITAAEREAIDFNHRAVARRGREPGLALQRDGRSAPLRAWAGDIINSMQGIAGLLDAGGGTGDYVRSVKACAERLAEPARTPSARMLTDLRQSGLPLNDFALMLSHRYREHFRSLPAAANEHYALLETEAQASLDRQCWIEEHDTLTFEEYLAAYYA
jgi:glutamate--cysteine ligase